MLKSRSRICSVCEELLDAVQYATGIHILSVGSLAVAKCEQDHHSAGLLEAEVLAARAKRDAAMAAYKQHLGMHQSVVAQSEVVLKWQCAQSGA
jgi:hypothetical protein